MFRIWWKEVSLFFLNRTSNDGTNMSFCCRKSKSDHFRLLMVFRNFYWQPSSFLNWLEKRCHVSQSWLIIGKIIVLYTPILVFNESFFLGWNSLDISASSDINPRYFNLWQILKGIASSIMRGVFYWCPVIALCNMISVFLTEKFRPKHEHTSEKMCTAFCKFSCLCQESAMSSAKRSSNRENNFPADLD